MLIVSLPSGQNEKNLVELISEISMQNLRKKQRKYEGTSIYSFNTSVNENEQSFYLSVLDGNVLLSKSVILIENAIRQQSLSKSLTDDEEFSDVLYTSGKNKDANLFIDLRKFTGIASIIANDEFGNKLKKYKDFGGWAEFDVNNIDNQTMFNGFLMSPASGDKFIDIFSNCDPANAFTPPT